MKLFDFFSNKPPEKGVVKDDARASVQTDFPGFFIMFKRKFWNISNLNLLMALFIVAVSFGVWKFSEFPDFVFYSFLLVCALLFGSFNAGTTYVTRGYVRGDPVYILSDFKYALKKNRFQAIVVGIIDLLVIALLVFDIFFWSGIDFNAIVPQADEQIKIEQQADDTLNLSADNLASFDVSNVTNDTLTNDGNVKSKSFINGVFFYSCIFLLFIYLMMRNYIYLLLVTFKMSIFKIFKNSFIFVFLGFKRNILAFIGILLVCLLNIYIFMYIQLVGVLLMLIMTVATCSFIGSYAAYPVIKKYMITPYYNDDEVFDAYDKIFEDRG